MEGRGRWRIDIIVVKESWWNRRECYRYHQRIKSRFTAFDIAVIKQNDRLDQQEPTIKDILTDLNESSSDVSE